MTLIFTSLFTDGVAHLDLGFIACVFIFRDTLQASALLLSIVLANHKPVPGEIALYFSLKEDGLFQAFTLRELSLLLSVMASLF